VAERLKTARGPEYRLTEAGREAAGLVVVLGEWGQRWLPRRAEDEDVDLEPLLIDMQRRLRGEALPKQPVVIRIDVEGFATRFLMLKAPEGALCHHNPGFPEGLRLKTPLPALIAWWRGDANFVEAQRRGLRLEGPRAMAREFPEWFDRYLFAPVASMAKTS
jgi:hypothetical protein